MDDVNSGAVDPVTSSVAQGPEASSQPEVQSAPSAGTLNTDEQMPEGVTKKFYDRFQEVNSKYREAETRLRQMETLQSQYAQYQQFDQIMGQNPQLAETVMATLRGYFQAQQAQQPQQSQYQSAGQDNGPLARIVENLYVRDFRDYAKSQGVDGPAVAYLENLAKKMIGQFNPDPVNNFDPSIIPTLFNESKRILDNFTADLQSKYIQQKNQDVLPPSTTQAGGVPMQTPPRLSNPQEIAQHLKQGLRQAGYGN